jgi:hypothetical protein
VHALDPLAHASELPAVSARRGVVLRLECSPWRNTADSLGLDKAAHEPATAAPVVAPVFGRDAPRHEHARGYQYDARSDAFMHPEHGSARR